MQYSASTLAAGAGLPLAGCQDTNVGGAAFAPYAHDPVRPENFTNRLFIRGGEGPFGVLGVTDAPLTLLVWPGETARIAVDFRQAFPGEQLFLFHCHNLEHENADMMVNYRVPA